MVLTQSAVRQWMWPDAAHDILGSSAGRLVSDLAVHQLWGSQDILSAITFMMTFIIGIAITGPYCWRI